MKKRVGSRPKRVSVRVANVAPGVMVVVYDAECIWCGNAFPSGDAGDRPVCTPCLRREVRSRGLVLS